MAQQANLHAATRRETGKGAARSLRREGKVPGVIYGHDRAPEALAVETAALNKMLIGISAGTTIVDVAIDDRAPVKALIREIQRDALGIPHIHASSDDDLFFAFGYAMAQDRLFQLDYLRRRGSGRLAEVRELTARFPLPR